MRKVNSMEQSKILSWWRRRQGFDGALTGKSAPEVLRRAGWARSVGSSNPYLTLFSRAGLDRENVDAAVARLEIHELPSARGCTYALPASDFALGLTVGQGFGGEMKVAEKLGVTLKEIDRLCDSIVTALENGPLDPDGLREATGSIAWMSFVKKDKSLQDAVARAEQYVRERLGDARSFSLDSPKSRAPRIEALRKAD